MANSCCDLTSGRFPGRSAGKVSTAAEVRPALLRRCGRGVAAMAEADAAALQIVRRHLDDDAVADAGADAEFAHLAGRVGQDLVAVVELHAEISVRQDLRDGPVEIQQLFFRHPLLSVWAGCRPAVSIPHPAAEVRSGRGQILSLTWVRDG